MWFVRTSTIAIIFDDEKFKYLYSDTPIGYEIGKWYKNVGLAGNGKWAIVEDYRSSNIGRKDKFIITSGFEYYKDQCK